MPPVDTICKPKLLAAASPSFIWFKGSASFRAKNAIFFTPFLSMRYLYMTGPA